MAFGGGVHDAALGPAGEVGGIAARERTLGLAATTPAADAITSPAICMP
jgi:hypothetical protein